jgi:hypothetical protein
MPCRAVTVHRVAPQCDLKRRARLRIVRLQDPLAPPQQSSLLPTFVTSGSPELAHRWGLAVALTTCVFLSYSRRRHAWLNASSFRLLRSQWARFVPCHARSSQPKARLALLPRRWLRRRPLRQRSRLASFPGVFHGQTSSGPILK